MAAHLKRHCQKVMPNGMKPMRLQLNGVLLGVCSVLGARAKAHETRASGGWSDEMVEEGDGWIEEGNEARRASKHEMIQHRNKWSKRNGDRRVAPQTIKYTSGRMYQRHYTHAPIDRLAWRTWTNAANRKRERETEEESQQKKEGTNSTKSCKNHAFVVFDSGNINCIVMLKTYTRNCHANG